MSFISNIVKKIVPNKNYFCCYKCLKIKHFGFRRRKRVDWSQLLNVFSNVIRAGAYLIVNVEKVALFFKDLFEI